MKRYFEVKSNSLYLLLAVFFLNFCRVPLFALKPVFILTGRRCLASCDRQWPQLMSAHPSVELPSRTEQSKTHLDRVGCHIRCLSCFMLSTQTFKTNWLEGDPRRHRQTDRQTKTNRQAYRQAYRQRQRQRQTEADTSRQIETDRDR